MQTVRSIQIQKRGTNARDIVLPPLRVLLRARQHPPYADAMLRRAGFQLRQKHGLHAFRQSVEQKCLRRMHTHPGRLGMQRALERRDGPVMKLLRYRLRRNRRRHQGHGQRRGHSSHCSHVHSPCNMNLIRFEMHAHPDRPLPCGSSSASRP